MDGISERNEEFQKRVNEFNTEIEMVNDVEIAELSDFEFDENGFSNEFPLYAGYTDENGVTHMTYVFREMNTSDEKEIHKPANKGNGGKVINTLLSRVVVKIGDIKKKDVPLEKWESVIKSLYSGDQDMMMLRIREANLGREIEADHECPEESCKAKLKTFFDTSEINIIEYKGEAVFPFSLTKGFLTHKGEKITDGTIRLPNGYDREVVTPIMINNPGEANILMLSRTVKFHGYDLKITTDLISRLIIKDSRILEKILRDNSFGLEFIFDTECTNCGRKIRIGLNQINFI